MLTIRLCGMENCEFRDEWLLAERLVALCIGLATPRRYIGVNWGVGLQLEGRDRTGCKVNWARFLFFAGFCTTDSYVWTTEFLDCERR